MTLDSLLRLRPLAASQSRTQGCSSASILLDDGTLLPRPHQLGWELNGDLCRGHNNWGHERGLSKAGLMLYLLRSPGSGEAQGIKTKQPKGLLFLSKFGTAPMVLTRLSRNFLFLSIGHPALGSAEENRRCQAFKSFGDRKAQTLKGFAVPRGLWLLHGAHIPYLLPSPRSDSPSCFPFPTALLTPGQTSP